VADNGVLTPVLNRAVPGPPGTGPGHGVLGMQERATLYGGQFFAAPRSGGGFGVHAWIPYPRGVSV